MSINKILRSSHMDYSSDFHCRNYDTYVKNNANICIWKEIILKLYPYSKVLVYT